MRSEGFSDFIELFSQFFTDWTEEGFEKAFTKLCEQLKERFDVDGEDHSYKVSQSSVHLLLRYRVLVV